MYNKYGLHRKCYHVYFQAWKSHIFTDLSCCGVDYYFHQKMLQQLLVCISGAPAAPREIKRKSVKEGDSITLYPSEIKKPNDLMSWYFNDTLIAEISVDQSKTCTDVQCVDADERFRDRLEVDHQTGSLTITNIDTTDLGLYKLQITSRNSSFIISSFKSFGVNVTGEYLFIQVQFSQQYILFTKPKFSCEH